MPIGYLSKHNPRALGELQHNQQEPGPRSPRKSRDEHNGANRGRSQSPTKNPFGAAAGQPLSKKDAKKAAKSRDQSPMKPKKTKSGTNLAGLLSRPKSLKNLYRLATEQEAEQTRDKENRTPDDTPSAGPPPPIFAQFTSEPSYFDQRAGRASVDVGRVATSTSNDPTAGLPAKDRPMSYQAPIRQQSDGRLATATAQAQRPNYASKGSSGGDSNASKSQRGRVRSAFASFAHTRSKSAATSPLLADTDPVLDPKDIDKHLEAMLDRRNIPEHQRYKMRNLNDTIKMEFIRQDWAEMQTAHADTSGSSGSLNSVDGPATSAIAVGSDCEDDKPKRTRGKSFTFSRGKKDGGSSTKKSRTEGGGGTLGRHFRSKSTDSVVSERPTSSSGGGTSSSTNLLAKIKLQQGPADYVGYLRKVQNPELVEVGKLHKLRLLLRNETVAWIEDFIQQGGMKEIVGLLNRIIDVEWREEHEDALLHENLLCLKALSTTGRAMQYLHTIQEDLFPKLLHMLFDPEKKGPSEFTTRNIITSVLFTYIQSATPADRTSRAKSVLTHLHDPQPKEDERPPPFVMEMRRERPYRLWCKEMVSVTKEVFWIFLHNLNVVALPSDKRGNSGHGTATPLAQGADPSSFMARNFPQERPPVPAAPYVGGVEWDATNYLASHLDLINAILACTPSAEERKALREDFRISGLERCLGGSLRLCKEKFYGSVHDALRTWVAAATEDGWDARDVRYGPPPEARSPLKKAGGGDSPKKKVEDAPRIDMPKLDFGLDRPGAHNDDGAWLS